MFYVEITYKNGSHAVLSTSCRMQGTRVNWSRSQAFKHARDCRDMMRNGKRPDWQSVRVVPEGF